MKEDRFGNLKQNTSNLLGKVKGAADQARGIRMQNPIKSVGLKLFLIFFLSIVLFVLVVGLMSFE